MKNVAIYGYGNSGKKIADMIVHRGRGKVCCFIDRSADKLRREAVCPIYTLKDFVASEPESRIDCLLISQENPECAEDVFREIFLSGLSIPVGYAPFSRFADGFKWGKVTWMEGRIFLARLVSHLMDSCNLKCKGCSHFANLFEEDSLYGMDPLLNDFFRISKLAYAPCIYLLGGEPLLNPHIGYIVTKVRDIFPDSDIEIVTNGLMIPTLKEDVLVVLREKEIRFSITQYPPTKMTRKRIEAVLTKHEINFSFGEEVQSFRVCFNRPGIFSDGRISQTKCRADYCRFLRYGKLYKCPVSGLVGKYNETFEDYKLPSDEGIDITALNFKELASRMCDPIKLCRYCAEEPRMVPWQVSTHPSASEWY